MGHASQNSLVVEANVMVSDEDHKLGVAVVAEDLFEAADIILPILQRKCQSAKQEDFLPLQYINTTASLAHWVLQ